MSADPVRAFYDGLADTYELIYADWQSSIERQGAALDRVLQSALGSAPARVLDCACGIGTQTLGLLRFGYRVVASDLSVRAVQRAALESSQRNLGGAYLAADMRELPYREASFDAVVCADNSLPHLLDLASLTAACASMAAVTRPGGVLVVSFRDYDRTLEMRPRSTPPSCTDTPDGRVITFQLWDWHVDGEHYDLEHFQLFQHGDDWTVKRRVITCWALTRQAIGQTLEQVGWNSCTWYEPEDSGFFQPVITARRTAEST